MKKLVPFLACVAVLAMLALGGCSWDNSECATCPEPVEDTESTDAWMDDHPLLTPGYPATIVWGDPETAKVHLVVVGDGAEANYVSRLWRESLSEVMKEFKPEDVCIFYVHYILGYDYSLRAGMAGEVARRHGNFRGFMSLLLTQGYVNEDIIRRVALLSLEITEEDFIAEMKDLGVRERVIADDNFAKNVLDIRGVPTTVAINTDNDSIFRIHGAQDQRAYVDFIRRIFNGESPTPPPPENYIQAAEIAADK
ncbi:MAG: hypothetical protein KKC05_01325 [Nanoarchaeota archaeon]|nr:hypothetical protein [Nanoarchaeota archaeon]